LGEPARADNAPGAEPPRTATTVAVYGPAFPPTAPDRSLYLLRYEIPPGTRLPAHHHEGTQVATIVSGTLTYHVLAGAVPIYRTAEGGAPVLDRALSSGEVGTIQPGEWLVEAEDVRHWGANEGPDPVVIYTASLLRAGAPLATPDPN
jgi:quercetin dioxygenase-like cupin family protein